MTDRTRWRVADYLAALVMLVGILLAFYLAGEVFHRVGETTRIEPDEDDTTVLHVIHKHWFAPDEHYDVRAVPDVDNDSTNLIWMRNVGSNQWERAFSFWD